MYEMTALIRDMEALGKIERLICDKYQQTRARIRAM